LVKSRIFIPLSGAAAAIVSSMLALSSQLLAFGLISVIPVRTRVTPNRQEFGQFKSELILASASLVDRYPVLG
jgi:hypothetical protein